MKNNQFAPGYRYYVDGVNLPESEIKNLEKMQETAEEIDWEDFESLVSVHDLGKFKFNVPLHRNWHVSFFKGTFKGLPCTYFVHSGIEHLFLPDGAEKLKTVGLKAKKECIQRSHLKDFL